MSMLYGLIFSLFVIVSTESKAKVVDNKIENYRTLPHYFSDMAFNRQSLLSMPCYDRGVPQLPVEVAHIVGYLMYEISIKDCQGKLCEYAQREVKKWNDDPWRGFSESPLVHNLWECFDTSPLVALLSKELCKHIIVMDPKELTGTIFKRDISVDLSLQLSHQATSSFNGFFEEDTFVQTVHFEDNNYDDGAVIQSILHFMIDNEMEELFDHALLSIRTVGAHRLWPNHFDPMRDALFKAVLSSKPRFVQKLRNANSEANRFCRMFARMIGDQEVMEALNSS